MKFFTILSRGIAYDKLGKPNQAIIDFTNALVLDPQNLNSHFCRATCYESIKAYELAIEDYMSALEMKITSDVFSE